MGGGGKGVDLETRLKCGQFKNKKKKIMNGKKREMEM